MNVFDYLEEMKQAILSKKTAVKDAVDKTSVPSATVISADDHYQEMLNMINVLKTEMEMAEYNYTVESFGHVVKTFDEYTVLQRQLNDEVILIQPLALGEEELSMIDMNSLCDVLRRAKESNLIKENIIVIPPNITVFKAKLEKPHEPDFE